MARSTAASRNAPDDDSPLDMSVRSRRATDECSSDSESSSQRAASESDPVIDEHFRRSLGQDYLALFPHSSNGGGGNKAQKRPPSPKKLPFDPTEDSNFTPLTGNFYLWIFLFFYDNLSSVKMQMDFRQELLSD